MRCKDCGHENMEDAKVCTKCGAQLHTKKVTETTVAFSPVESEEKEAPVEVEDKTEEAVFVVKKGPSVGQRFPLKQNEITLGRDPQSDIFLDDITVSRKHARVDIQGPIVKVIDVGSLNGTYVNGTRTDTAILKHGDEVQIGKFKLIFLEGRD